MLREYSHLKESAVWYLQRPKWYNRVHYIASTLHISHESSCVTWLHVYTCILYSMSILNLRTHHVKSPTDSVPLYTHVHGVGHTAMHVHRKRPCTCTCMCVYTCRCRLCTRDHEYVHTQICIILHIEPQPATPNTTIKGQQSQQGLLTQHPLMNGLMWCGHMPSH